jgi:hypothetical protein
MEQKKKDVLIVRDEKTGEVSVVAGLNADGTPKRIPPKVENSRDFLQFDKHGDMLDNFFKNFFRQCKEPSRFGFYRVAAEQADKLLDVMKELLKAPEANKELLAPHRVDTADYEKKAKEGVTQQTGTETKEQEAMGQKEEAAQEPKQEKKGYQPIDENKVNWQELEEKWGIRREDLEKSGDLTKMLNYGKSDLVRVSPKFGGESFELDARLSLRRNEDGSIGLVPHFIRKEQKLDEYKDHKFTAEDKRNLKQTGNLGRVVDLADKRTGEIIPSIVSIDRKTNEITDMPASRLRIPEKIGQTAITPQEQALLRAGLPVKDKHVVFSDGREFVTTLQANVEKRGAEFVPGTTRPAKKEQSQENGVQQKTPGEAQDGKARQERRNTWTDENGNIKPIGQWKGVTFTEQQKADYVAGNTIKLENVPDDKGNPATMYIRFNREKGRPFRYDKNPDTAQKVAPSNESRIQTAVNNEGKTNEATKNVKEPLKKGQTAPASEDQKRQQDTHQKKNKGIKV